MPRVRSSWPAGDPAVEQRQRPRDDVVLERLEPDGTYTAVGGPFRSYRRRVVEQAGGTVTETIHYSLAVPWFWWVYALPVRHALRHPPRTPGRQPWWAPPDRLDPRSALVLGLLAAATLAVGYLNTLFTQTAAFAAEAFGASPGAQGVAGTVVRFGIVLALPLVFLADRRGRRRMLLVAIAVAPVLAALGALAPSFAALTATQTLSRPIAIVLGLVVGIVAAEEMPPGSRAYAVSVLAMSTGLGAGLCVVALPLADLGPHGWRWLYVLPLVFLVIGVDLHRRLPESRRFELPHARAPRFHRRRFALLAASAFLTNLLVSPASFFQNRYLKDIRNYSAAKISLYTVATNTPGGLGIIVGGRLADVHGRRVVGAVALAGGTIFTVATFSLGGWPLWLTSALAAIIGGAAVPALGVYGAELFPTGHRGRASGLISMLSLIGSSIGLLTVGWLLDRGVGYGPTMALMGIGPLVVAVLVISLYPETAHLELEELNPEDRAAGHGASRRPGQGQTPSEASQTATSAATRPSSPASS